MEWESVSRSDVGVDLPALIRNLGGPAVTLAETALSIIAEIVATSHARSGNALSDLSCAIH